MGLAYAPYIGVALGVACLGRQSELAVPFVTSGYANSLGAFGCVLETPIASVDVPNPTQQPLLSYTPMVTCLGHGFPLSNNHGCVYGMATLKTMK